MFLRIVTWGECGSHEYDSAEDHNAKGVINDKSAGYFSDEVRRNARQQFGRKYAEASWVERVVQLLPQELFPDRVISVQGVEERACLRDEHLSSHWNVLEEGSRIPWQLLPPVADPYNYMSEIRARKKRWQIDCLYQFYAKWVAIAFKLANRRLVVVDFGSSSGHVGVPFALLFPGMVDVWLVDFNEESVRIGHERISDIPNCRIFHGDIRAFDEPFDLGIALHACGAATDYVLDMAIARGAAFLLCSCCVGKLRHADSTLQLPHSRLLGRHWSRSHYLDVASSADHPGSEYKRIVEDDRLQWAHESGKYRTLIRSKLVPGHASPKNDIIFGCSESLQ